MAADAVPAGWILGLACAMASGAQGQVLQLLLVLVELGEAGEAAAGAAGVQRGQHTLASSQGRQWMHHFRGRDGKCLYGPLATAHVSDEQKTNFEACGAGSPAGSDT